MIEKKIIVCMGDNEAGEISIRLSLLRIEDEEVTHRHYCRPSPIPDTIPPGLDLNEIRANIETWLAQPKEHNGLALAPWPKIPDEEWRKFEGFVNFVHTPEVLAKASAEQDVLIAEIRSKRESLKTESDALMADITENARKIEAAQADLLVKIRAAEQTERDAARPAPAPR